MPRFNPTKIDNRCGVCGGVKGKHNKLCKANPKHPLLKNKAIMAKYSHIKNTKLGGNKGD